MYIRSDILHKGFQAEEFELYNQWIIHLELVFVITHLYSKLDIVGQIFKTGHRKVASTDAHVPKSCSYMDKMGNSSCR